MLLMGKHEYKFWKYKLVLASEEQEQEVNSSCVFIWFYCKIKFNSLKFGIQFF